MKCPHCGADSRVLETRESNHFTLSRRRECERCRERFTTVEVHQVVYTTAKPRAKVYAATIRSRLALVARDIEIAQRVYLGWETMVREFGLSRRAIFHAVARGRKHIKERRS